MNRYGKYSRLRGLFLTVAFLNSMAACTDGETDNASLVFGAGPGALDVPGLWQDDDSFGVDPDSRGFTKPDLYIDSDTPDTVVIDGDSGMGDTNRDPVDLVAFDVIEDADVHGLDASPPDDASAADTVDGGAPPACVADNACDDLNVCTDDRCVDGVCQHLANSGVCDDQNPCTELDRCANTLCKGTALLCDDGDPCSSDGCDPALGCTHAPDTGALCDDGNGCTVGDLCVAGACTPGDASGCGCVSSDDCLGFDDGNICNGVVECLDGQCGIVKPTMNDVCAEESFGPCFKGVCDPQVGGCAAMMLPDGSACDDLDVCSANSICQSGVCKALTAVSCEDNNPCTLDKCEPESGGCVSVLQPEVACDDGNICTQDFCLTGESGDPECGYVPKLCDDNDDCTANGCDAAIGCVFSEPIQCNDGNPCTDDMCVDAACLYVPNTSGCDDGNPCTAPDLCMGAACTGMPSVCDDGNPCTLDNCDPATGCDSVVVAGVCDDMNSCTVDDVCVNGNCVGTPVSCEDGNSCTKNYCDSLAGVCVQVVNVGSPCDDDNACTVADLCIGAACQGIATSCDDSDPCTEDLCDPALGCVYAKVSKTTCSDGNVCTTQDVCDNGTCSGTPLVCNDGNPCTEDKCVVGAGCTATVTSGIPCDDGNACTIGDSCVAGVCKGTGLSCDDNNPCTSDSCLLNGLCSNTSKTGPCDDGNPCTDKDTCTSGKCAGQALLCDDGNPCTLDYCDPSKGCKNEAVKIPCNDNNACTTDDLCNQGICAGVQKQCSDGNGCTADICDPATGCAYVPQLVACDDKNVCTHTDKCNSSGTCAGTATTCNDNNVCTQDACDSAKGCVYTPVSIACDDKNGCTQNDKCNNGQCTGTLKSCNDGNSCTIDNCSLGNCVHTAAQDGLACDDGDDCTKSDACVSGTCKGKLACVPAGCTGSNKPGCGGCGCESCVCDLDPYCCNVKWDNQCVLECTQCGGCGLAPACTGKCGGGTFYCKCDADCLKYGDCCADACQTCGVCK